MFRIIWSDYFRYKATLRGFNLAIIEEIVRYSGERYYDTLTGRMIVIGRYDNRLVMIPYEQIEHQITPITIHVTTRQQIRFRLMNGRLLTDV